MLKETEKSFFSENIRYRILCPSDFRSVNYTVGMLSSYIAPGSTFLFQMKMQKEIYKNVNCYMVSSVEIEKQHI